MKWQIITMRAFCVSFDEINNDRARKGRIFNHSHGASEPNIIISRINLRRGELDILLIYEIKKLWGMLIANPYITTEMARLVYNQCIMGNGLFGVFIIFRQIMPAIFRFNIQEARSTIITQNFVPRIIDQNAHLIEMSVTQTLRGIFSNNRQAFWIFRGPQYVERAFSALLTIPETHRFIVKGCGFARSQITR